jgi:antirestriction protein
MTKKNNLEIRCNCDPDQPEMAVHLVNGAIPIIIIKCEKCEAAYTVMPNSVQHA